MFNILESTTNIYDYYQIKPRVFENVHSDRIQSLVALKEGFLSGSREGSVKRWSWDCELMQENKRPESGCYSDLWVIVMKAINNGNGYAVGRRNGLLSIWDGEQACDKKLSGSGPGLIQVDSGLDLGDDEIILEDELNLSDGEINGDLNSRNFSQSTVSNNGGGWSTMRGRKCSRTCWDKGDAWGAPKEINGKNKNRIGALESTEDNLLAGSNKRMFIFDLKAKDKPCIFQKDFSSLIQGIQHLEGNRFFIANYETNASSRLGVYAWKQKDLSTRRLRKEKEIAMPVGSISRQLTDMGKLIGSNSLVTAAFTRGATGLIDIEKGVVDFRRRP